MGGSDTIQDLTSVDITKTWCDAERTLESMRPALTTLMTGEGVQYESAAALVMERIRSIQRKCQLAREASEQLSASEADDAAKGQRRQTGNASAHEQASGGRPGDEARGGASRLAVAKRLQWAEEQKGPQTGASKNGRDASKPDEAGIQSLKRQRLENDEAEGVLP